MLNFLFYPIITLILEILFSCFIDIVDKYEIRFEFLLTFV